MLSVELTICVWRAAPVASVVGRALSIVPIVTRRACRVRAENPSVTSDVVVMPVSILRAFERLRNFHLGQVVTTGYFLARYSIQHPTS